MKEYKEVQRNRALLLLVTVFFLERAIAGEPGEVRRETTVIMENAHEITFSGSLSVGAVESVIRTLNAYPINRIVINSEGGEVESSIRLARHIRDKKIELVVQGMCISSCANYLFVAATSKKVLSGSFVAIHGSIQALCDEKLESLPDSTDATCASEKAFFSEFLVSESPFSSWNNYAKKYRALYEGADGKKTVAHQPIMWALSLSDWEKMGVKGIQNWWYPTSTDDLRFVSLMTGIPAEYIFFGTEPELSVKTRAMDAR